MDQPTHIIDPDGEVLIHLRHANAPFASLDEGLNPTLPQMGAKKENNKKNQSDIAQPAEAPVDGETSGDEDEEEEQEPETRFCIRVSAKHLTLASPVFKKQLTGSWKEGIAYQEKGSVEITTEGWDIDAFLLLLKIMHCHLYHIPKKLPLEMLAKVAVLLDYYECAEVMRFFTHMWLHSIETSEEVEDEIPTSYSRNLILWLWIAWFYKTPALFEDLTSTAMSQSDQVITNLGLPIAEAVIRAMNDRRSEAINTVVSLLHDKHEDFLEDRLGCGFECSSIMYGALSKAMKSNNLLSPRPVAPFTGLNYKPLVKKVLSFESPRWYFLSGSRAHGCNESSFEELFEELKDTIEGLQLSDHVSHIPWVMDI